MAKLPEEIVVKVRTDVDVGYDAIHLLTWIRNMSIRWPKGTASERLKLLNNQASKFLDKLEVVRDEDGLTVEVKYASSDKQGTKEN